MCVCHRHGGACSQVSTPGDPMKRAHSHRRVESTSALWCAAPWAPLITSGKGWAAGCPKSSWKVECRIPISKGNLLDGCRVRCCQVEPSCLSSSRTSSLSLTHRLASSQTRCSNLMRTIRAGEAPCRIKIGHALTPTGSASSFVDVGRACCGLGLLHVSQSSIAFAIKDGVACKNVPSRTTQRNDNHKNSSPVEW